VRKGGVPLVFHIFVTKVSLASSFSTLSLLRKSIALSHVTRGEPSLEPLHALR